MKNRLAGDESKQWRWKGRPCFQRCERQPALHSHTQCEHRHVCTKSDRDKNNVPGKHSARRSMLPNPAPFLMQLLST